MMSKLVELIPDVEELVEMAPDELAGHILKSIGQNSMSCLVNFLSELFGSPRAQYSNDHGGLARRAVVEAWTWAENHTLLVAPDTANGANGWRILSREAETVIAEDRFEEFRQSASYPKLMLHDRIREAAWSSFKRRRLDTAVFEAFREVEIGVRAAGGFGPDKYGKGLVYEAFKINDGPLTDPSQPIAEQESLRDLFAGAIGSYKNPHSHRSGLISEAAECFEMLVLASHLIRIVEGRTRTTAPV